MNKQGTLIAATTLAALLCVAGCGTNAPAATTPMSDMAMPTATMPAASMAPDSMAGMIHIESGTYRDAAPVAAGATVTVMNMDDAAYTVTADDGSFNIEVPAGAMATFKAPLKAGRYAFHSAGHEGMHGNLTVR